MFRKNRLCGIEIDFVLKEDFFVVWKSLRPLQKLILSSVRIDCSDWMCKCCLCLCVLQKLVVYILQELIVYFTEMCWFCEFSCVLQEMLFSCMNYLYHTGSHELTLIM